MTRSVEIPEAAVEAVADALAEAGFVDPDDGTVGYWRDGEEIPVWVRPTTLVRVALEAAATLPYLAPACQGDGVCTNPTCPTHGIKWDVPAGDGGLRKALERQLESLPTMAFDNGYPVQALPKSQLLSLLALYPAAPAVPQPAGDSVRDALALLVQLKDGPRDQVYYDTRDEAWQSAREALAAHNQ